MPLSLVGTVTSLAIYVQGALDLGSFSMPRRATIPYATCCTSGHASRSLHIHLESLRGMPEAIHFPNREGWVRPHKAATGKASLKSQRETAPSVARGVRGNPVQPKRRDPGHPSYRLQGLGHLRVKRRT